ncbi:MAG TPA: hypothetical protein VH619_12030 [Verrucomicrobiae bacterium]|jgi:hypothetical protein|nr:hypothetical protein [Verrucomicrobiae bacterium]
MKTRFVVILVLLNVAALGAGFLYFSQYREREAAQTQESTQAELAAWQARATAVQEQVESSVMYKTNAFNWRQVESSDYREYIANLRGIGCPESTIKDIIMTDVMRLYAQRLGQYYRNGRDFKFWETDDKRKLKQPQIEEREKQLAAINKELPAVLRELLGINYEREINKYFVDTDEDNRRLDFLSDDKRSQVLALRDQFEGERERAKYQAEDGKLSAADIYKLRQIDQDQDAALSQLLTPQEKEDYELSESPTADKLRKQLIGFNPTEEEFRQIFEKQKAIDSAYEYDDTNDESVRSAEATDEQTMMADFKAQLSPDRVGQLDQSQDPDYQNLCVLSERYDLPDGTSQALLDMRQTAEDQKRQLLANKDISPEQMEVALKAMQAETEREARAALGDDAYAQYSQSAAWIQNLGTN